ncbi:Two-component system histidine kinase DccS [hydrothermal vent metagenome]|uniref:histidine kinase n=1 Tax=hydrothermal vent metagenome TaxID=652676 RepID=A0A1W1C7T1_9ZZZZ
MKKTLLLLFVLLLISLAFAYYTLGPLKKALQLNDEFIKDILHDINTPLSALRINLKILKKQFGENDSIQRSQISIDTILDMQSNFRYFLTHSKLEIESIDISPLIQQKVVYYGTIYKNLSFHIDIKDVKITTNQEAFSRIIDNIISNACKYNTPHGKVNITYQNAQLIISDTGVGIHNIDKIFDRYYKESQRGIGIGLDIVKKLCDNLNIQIKIESKVNEGTHFILIFGLSELA